MTCPGTASATVPDLAAFLRGRWDIERHIDDHRRGLAGRFSGIGTYAPHTDGLEYREAGTLAYGRHAVEAVQRHLYRLASRARAEVRFADGRRFHDLDLSRGVWFCRHPCGADLYTGTFRVLGADAWTQIWEVEGPDKRATLAATFRRRL